MDKSSLINIPNPINTTNFTLIIPSVSVGNVGQLTADLLISSHDFKKYATIWDPAIIPSVGSDPFTGNSPEVYTACELYINETLRTVVMQLRSSIEFKLALKFFQKLQETIAELKFKDVIILTSSFAHEMHNVSSSPFRYVTNDADIQENLTRLNIPPMEQGENGRLTIYGAGFATKLYEILASDLKCTVLVKYSSEGDNRPDAFQMLNVLYNIIKTFNNLNTEDVKFPSSWSFVFGNPPPIGIY